MKVRWLLITAGLLVAVVAALVVASVVTSSPRECARCHTGEADVLAETPHADVNCYDCHAFPGEVAQFKVFELTRMYPMQLLGNEPSGPVRETARQSCLACHEPVLSGITTGETGIRIQHAACAPGPTCDECHATLAHGEEVRWPRHPVMERCTACHIERKVSIECDTCHVGRLKQQRLDVGPWRTTHGPEWAKTHGMGDHESCRTCHEPDQCEDCHGVEIPHDPSFGARHGQAAMDNPEGCETCHHSRGFCDACHGLAMPHSATYLQQHADIAQAIDDPTCTRCHSVADCERCHVEHIHPGGASAGLDALQAEARVRAEQR